MYLNAYSTTAAFTNVSLLAHSNLCLGNTGHACGGCLRWQVVMATVRDVVMRIEHNVFVSNQVNMMGSYSGGAVCARVPSGGTNVAIVLRHNLFDSNSAPHAAGAVDMGCYAGSVAGFFGTCDGARLIVEHNTFLNSTVTVIDVLSSAGAVLVGAMQSVGGMVLIQNNTFDGCSATSGGAVFVDVMGAAFNLNISNNTFQNNQAVING